MTPSRCLRLKEIFLSLVLKPEIECQKLSSRLDVLLVDLWSKNSIYNFRIWIEQFHSTVKHERGRVELFYEFQLFGTGIIAQIFPTKYLSALQTMKTIYTVWESLIKTMQNCRKPWCWWIRVSGGHRIFLLLRTEFLTTKNKIIEDKYSTESKNHLRSTDLFRV